MGINPRGLHLHGRRLVAKSAAEGNDESEVALLWNGGYTPEAREVGRASGFSASVECTLWRTSEPCTQKMTSSAMFVAWSATRSRFRATSNASSDWRTISGRSFMVL